MDLSPPLDVVVFDRTEGPSSVEVYKLNTTDPETIAGMLIVAYDLAETKNKMMAMYNKNEERIPDELMAPYYNNGYNAFEDTVIVSNRLSGLTCTLPATDTDEQLYDKTATHPTTKPHRLIIVQKRLCMQYITAVQYDSNAMVQSIDTALKILGLNDTTVKIIN